MEPNLTEALAPQAAAAMPMAVQQRAIPGVAMTQLSSAPVMTLVQQQALAPSSQFAQQTQYVQQAQPRSSQGQFQFVVPDSHLAGQPLMFDMPEGVRVAVPISASTLPGSLVTAQYPLPARLAPALPTVQVQAQEIDRQAAQRGWILYGIGWFMTCCFCHACGPFVWLLAAGLYFCKPAEYRNQAPRARRAAQAACFTCAGLACLAFLFCVVSAIYLITTCNAESSGSTRCHFHGHFHAHDHHHGHDGPPGQVFLKTPDCFSDQECSKMVDFGKLEGIKARLLPRIEDAKEKPAEVAQLLDRLQVELARAGVPQDRTSDVASNWAMGVGVYRASYATTQAVPAVLDEGVQSDFQV